MVTMRFLVFPILVVAVMVAFAALDGAFGWRGPRIPWLGWPIVAAGGALAAWCTVLFARLGRGTPNPFTAKTRNLVVDGPYRVVRNPMMWGIGAMIAGVALALGNAGLWLGFAAFLVWIGCFIPGYEERDMERRFGDPYREYCRAVPRFWPRLGRNRGL